MENIQTYLPYLREYNYTGKMPVVIDFFATWCGPCKAFAPALERLAKVHEGKIKVLKVDVDKYEALGEFDCGIFGTDILIRTLCENGYKDLAYELLTSEKENTFYNMKKHGATTLWENWNGAYSHSHPMFGAVVKYLVEYFNEV